MIYDVAILVFRVKRTIFNELFLVEVRWTSREKKNRNLSGKQTHDATSHVQEWNSILFERHF